MAGVDADEFRRWREQAASALAAARALADAEPAWSCFLAEQAAQLGVKGLLHAVGLDAWGHDLVALEARLHEPLGDAWPDLSSPAGRLARFYIPTRYPDAHPGGVPARRYGPTGAAGALDDAAAILVAVDRAFAALGDEP
jgi:HEPN domain-containing protein